MATQSTGGGSTTSFTNTPQAKDDNYLFIEDVLRNNSTLYNASTNTIILDVMSNDLGGNAKSLFSVEDGDGNPITADFDLLTKDVDASGVSNWEATFGGNWVRINNGKVEFRISDGSGVPGQGRSVDSLTDGQAFSDQFVYAIRLGNGTLSEATVKINITGANDLASIAVHGPSDNAVAEAGGTANGLPGDPSAGGTLVVNDADLGQNKFQTPPSLAGTYGNFTFNANTGAWTYTLDNSRSATEALSQGQLVTETLTVKSLDGTATYSIVVNVTGSNDAPDAVNDTGSGNEDALITGSVATNDSDVDAGASLTYSLNGAAPAGFTLNPDGSWSLDASNAAYQHLAQGASTDVIVSYTVSDGLGGTDTATLTITVHGLNDAPDALNDVGSGNEDALITGSVATNDSDVDDGASLTYSLNSAPPAGFLLNPNGSWSLDASNTAYQHLAQGASTDVVVSYTVSDGLGGTDVASLTITVHGVNDAPDAANDVGQGNEDALITGSVATNDSDVDDGASLTYTLNGAPPAGFTLNPDGSWSLDASNTAYQHLAQGASTDVIVNYTVSDGLGGTDTASLTITVHGINDAPEALNDTGSGNEDSLISGSVATNDSDVDDGASLTYTLNGAPPAGFTLNPDGSWSLDASNTAYQHLAQGASTDVVVNYTVSDGLGGTDTASLTITVHGVNDAPDAVNDTGSGNEDSLISGSVATNDSDVDDGASLTYTLNGAPPAGFTLNPDGSWSLDASNTAYQHLAQGASTDVIVSYTVSDDLGGTDTASLTITVHGVNDAPEAVNDTGSGNEDALISGSVATNDSDVDDGASLTYTLNGAPPAGFTLNPDGSWSLDTSNTAYQHLAQGASTDVFVSYTVSDGLGGTDTASLTITVHGVNDAPDALNDVGDGNEDALISGSVATNDSDPDDGASLTYTLNGAPPAGFTLNPDGTWSLDASNSAYQHLAAGASTDVVVNYTVSDGLGGSDTASLTITVHGLNDAPDAVNDVGDGNEDALISGSVANNDSDPDDGASLTYSLNGAPPAGFTLNPDGSWSLDASNTAYQHLAAGASTDVIVNYTVSDGLGGTDTASLTITVHGVNDAPDAVNDTGSGNEDALISGSVATNDSDPDDGASLTYSLNGAPPAGFTLNPDGSWSLDASNTAYQHLAQGASTDVVVNYTVSDGLGGTDTASLTITVHGVNDAPEALNDTGSGNEDTLISGSVATNDSDPDNGASLTYSLNGAPPAGFTLNPDGSWSLDASNTAYQHLAQGASTDVVVSYTVNDGLGGTDTASLTITVHGVNDAPDAVNDTGSGNEDALISGTVATNDSDPDDGSSLTYALNGPPPAGFTLNPNGSWSLDASNTAYQHLAGGASTDVVVNYTVSDGLGGTDTASLTITVHGVNDAPTVANAIADQSSAEDMAWSYTVPANSFADVDDGAALTYTATLGNGGALPSWLSFDASTRTFSGTPPLNFNGSLDLKVTASDGSLAASDTFTLNITPVNDAPVNTVPGAQLVSSGSSIFVGGISVGDVDSAILTTTLSTTNGGMLVGNVFGTTITGNGTNLITITGTQALINASLASLNYLASAFYSGPDSITVSTTDGSATDVDVIPVTIQAGRFAPTDIQLTPSDPGNDVNFNSFDLVGKLTATDVDTGAISFTVVNQTNAGQFSVSGTTLNGTDLGTNQVLSVTIRATQAGDPGGMFLDETFIIRTGTNGNSGETMNGVTGDDVMYGNGGNDMLFGLGGNDTLFGMDGSDQLDGGAGDDRLDGGAGGDTLTGGAGNDLFVLETGGGGFDTITDYAAGEIIDVTSILSVSAGTNVVTGGYVRVTTTGLLQVDLNGATGGQVWTTIANVNTGAGPYTVQYLSGGVLASVNLTAVAPPIALDLNGDGVVSFIGTDGGATFDYGSGKVQTAWVGPQDGILVRDANHDGQVTANEMVFATDGSDLEGLRVYDSNGDGKLDAADAKFAEFAVWQDANSNGKVDAGELHSLTAEGIASISLSSDGKSYFAAGGDVNVVGTGSFTRADGSTGVLADAVFATGGKVSNEQLIQSGSSGTLALAAAVAAAGLAASAPLAAEPAHSDPAPAVQAPNEPAASLVVEPVESQAHDTAEPVAEAKPAESASHSTEAPANHSLMGSEMVQAVDPASETASADAPAVADHLAALPVAPALVAMPSPELLAAAFAGQAGHGDAPTQIVAEALQMGQGGSVIDALIDAAAPQAAGHADHGALAIFGEASGVELSSLMMAPGMGHGLSMQHPDAVQHV